MELVQIKLSELGQTRGSPRYSGSVAIDHVVQSKFPGKRTSGQFEFYSNNFGRIPELYEQRNGRMAGFDCLFVCIYLFHSSLSRILCYEVTAALNSSSVPDSAL